MQPNFIHLDVHTEYSISDGICRIPDLINTVAAQKLPAVAINDRTNLFGAVKFYKEATRAGIKPIFGAEVLVATPEQALTPMILLCGNTQGYRQLTVLLSRAYQQQAEYHQPIIQRGWLQTNTQGLLAISGGYHSDIGRALLSGDSPKAKTLAQDWSQLFPARFYLMISRVGREQEELYIQQAAALASALQLPMVATNEVRFIKADDFAAHEARVAIHQGYTLDDPKRPHHYTAQQYLRSAQEMHELFADFPEALQNTVEVAKRCNLALDLGKYYLPNFPLPEGTTAEQCLCLQAQKGLESRLNTAQINDTGSYQSRLQIELEVINAMGFASYFLIVADFIQWSKKQNIPVGPGRGSGAGSLVAYALGITDLDPLQYDLLFERFLNPERVSLPDFDIDFCMQRRDEVIDYVAQRYGRDKVSQIITFGTMAAKAVVRDVGRVQGYPYGFVDKIAKLIPFELGMTLEKALVDSDLLRDRYEQEEEVKDLIDLALKLEGITRNAGKHAGGVVIAPSALTDFVPLYCEEDGSSLVTQFDKDDVEAIGLVKFDFLGLRTLTIIQWACETINALPTTTTPVDITRIPLDDKATFRLLQRCHTTAVFQLESRGMKDLIKRLQPDCFEDIIALVALFRPGPLQSGMVDDFINRKHGRAKATYLHPSLEPVLRPTYGVILYQEQVMQIAQVLAGYTLGSADLLRRAMGKKKPEEMAQQREIFVTGSVERGVDQSLASNIFDLMEKFAGYGFNKSHSAAYALLAYQTGWLKAHYPAAFMAAVLSSDMDNTDKVVNFIDDCHQLKVNVLPPDINQSLYRFTVHSNDILYGLGAIKGAGEAAIENMIAARSAGGKFTCLFDLCKRVDGRKVNRRVLEAFIRAGALDSLYQDRASLLASLDKAMKLAEKHAQNLAQGQVDLFGGAGEQNMAEEYVQVPAWTLPEILDGEKITLGLYLSGHPLDTVIHDLRQLLPGSLKQLRAQKGSNQWLAGLIVAIRTVKTRQGKQMQIVSIEDKTAKIDLVLFPDDVEAYRELLIKDQLIFAEGEVSNDDFNGGLRVRAKRLLNLAQIRAICAKGISIQVNAQQISDHFAEHLMGWVKPFVPGSCPIEIHYQGHEAAGTLRLASAWWVNASDELIALLQEKIGKEQVKVEYKTLG
ncbi:MAG: DNA polymerase III subunit alpha [Gammaproteobacteria bacterium]